MTGGAPGEQLCWSEPWMRFSARTAGSSRDRTQKAPREATGQRDRLNRDPGDPAHQPALPATGPAPAGRQRRALPGPPPQRLPRRRRRVPGHHPTDDHPRARRNHHLYAQDHHRDAGPARPAPRRPRPRPAPRRDQHQPAHPARRRPTHHLSQPPTVTVIALSRPLTAGGLRLVSLSPSSRATSAIGRDVSTTILAASSRNSGVYVLIFTWHLIPSFPVMIL
jgi:hypothetical protein